VRLVLAGNHQQFADHLRSVYRPGGGISEPPREISTEQHLWGVNVEAVDSFKRIGTYWENPVWGSSSFAQFMQEALLAHKSWAMEWNTEWHVAEKCRLRAPIELASVRESLLRLEQELIADE
jgi:hypothetical protein